MEWRTIPGYSDYEVSDTGLVRSKVRTVLIVRSGVSHTRTYKSQLIKPQKRPGSRYFTVRIHNDSGSNRTLYIHRLVMLGFIGPSTDFVLHTDDDPGNNHLTNLRYGTAKENSQDCRTNGNLSCGTKVHWAVLSELTVSHIKRVLIPLGLTDLEIGNLYGVHYSAIYKIRNNLRWKHVR